MQKQRRWSSRYWRIGSAVAVTILIAFIAGVFLLERASSRWSQEKIVGYMRQRFQSEIEMADLRVSLFPNPGVEIDKLRIRHKGRGDVLPLIQVEKVAVSNGFWNLVRTPVHVSDVRLEGLLIHVPPRSKDDRPSKVQRDKPASPQEESEALFVVDEIRANGSELRILPKEDFKEPLVFEMKNLRLWRVGSDRPLRFQTEMTNAKPPGLIQSEGSFGPWDSDEPGDTPVSGEYSFHDADLGVFNGIRGILSSTGSYEGVLSRLDVSGECDVPEFTVEASGHPVHLKTVYKAVVDGTSGDTLLQPVEASFLNTRLTAKGGVVQKRGIKGKTVELDVNIPEARIEDLLRLAVKSELMPLRGAARVKTHFELPPGEAKIHQRLDLRGEFQVSSAKFPDLNIQKKIETLSNRASGEPEKEPTGDVVSDLGGSFGMDSGVVSLSNLVFAVPSAKVALDGSYGMDDEELDFKGTLTMDAKISEATTGFKSILAKIVDPFFSKDHAGAVIPIKVTGSKSEPKFGLALGGGKKDKR